eukprot:3941441-Rhodomonas_salina.6
MSGTDLGYAATRYPVYAWLRQLASTLIGQLCYPATRRGEYPATRISYAVSGTDLARGAIYLGAFYAVPGTDVVHGATVGLAAALLAWISFMGFYTWYAVHYRLRDARY